MWSRYRLPVYTKDHAISQRVLEHTTTLSWDYRDVPRFSRILLQAPVVLEGTMYHIFLEL